MNFWLDSSRTMPLELAVLVIKDDKAVYQHGYGVTDLRTNNKIDEHTNFRLASLASSSPRWQ